MQVLLSGCDWLLDSACQGEFSSDTQAHTVGLHIHQLG